MDILRIVTSSNLYLIPYMYKFSRDVIFADYPNLGFPRFYFRGSLEDLNFVDDKLPVKTAKFTSLENLYVYGINLQPQAQLI